MSRHQKVNAMVKKAMDEDSYSDQSYQDQLPQLYPQQEQSVESLMLMFDLQREQGIKIFVNSDYNFDKAVKYLERIQTKKKKPKKSQQPKKQSQLPTFDKKTHSMQSQPSQASQRKNSSELQMLPRRKSSYIAEQIQVCHYNKPYPPRQYKDKPNCSKAINIVVVGHVDSGKSTLVGKFLNQMQIISKKEHHKNQKEAKQQGKESFRYAYVTDSTSLQKQKGITIDVGVRKLFIQDRQIIFLDSPGHRDFIPNMITGAAQADYAILVIDVTHFQATFIAGGQTKEHAYIVRSLGVGKIIVAMNKMDNIKWDVQSFKIIQNKLNPYLLKIGFTEDQIQYLPISALLGQNLAEIKKQFVVNEKIYNRTLLEIFKSLELPKRPLQMPFRLNVSNFYDSQTGKIRGHCLSGKIQAGIIQKEQKCVIMPQNVQCLVKDILISGQKVSSASTGDNVDIHIKLIEEAYLGSITYGNVLSSVKLSIPVTKSFSMEALVLEIDQPILKGTEVMVYIGTDKSLGVITKINYVFDPVTGIVLKKKPRMLRSQDCAQIQVETKQKMCCEIFSNNKAFGRVILREKKSTLCVGTIKQIK